MKKYIKWTAAAVTGLMMMTSCNSYLDLKPTSSLSDADIQALLGSSDQTKVNLALSKIASRMDGWFRLIGGYNGFSGGLINSADGQEILHELSGNDIVYGERPATMSGYDYTLYNLGTDNKPWLSANTDVNMAFWQLPASIPMGANKVMQYLTEELIATSPSPAVKNGRAMALTVRALGYMMLMERYTPSYLNGGKEAFGMPLYTKYQVNAPATIATPTETYDFIKKDLKDAITLFSALDGNGYTAAKSDVDMGVAQFLLARVSLLTGDYTTCISACQELLSHLTSFIPEANYGVKASNFDALQAKTKEAKASDNAFLCVAANPECILGWVNGDGANTYYNSMFNPFLGAGSEGQPQFLRTDDYLYKQIDPRDFRKDNTMLEAKNYTYPTYKGKTLTNTLQTYTNIKWGATIPIGYTARTGEKADCDLVRYRSSEVLLMLAEAQAMSGKGDDAKTTLNKLLAARTRGGATTMTCDNYSSMSGMSAINMVKLQWRIEMWGENGLDYWNAKRWNAPIDRTKSTLHWSDGKTLDVVNMTYGVPEVEYQRNPNWPTAAYK